MARHLQYGLIIICTKGQTQKIKLDLMPEAELALAANSIGNSVRKKKTKFSLKGLENDKAEHIFADPPYTQASAESDQEWRLCSLKDEIRSFAISAENQGQFCLQDHDLAFWKALWFKLKHSAFLAQLLLDEVDEGSTSEPASPVGKPVLHMQHTCSGEPVTQSPDDLPRPASNNMPLSEYDTQELQRLLYLRAEGIERQERLQYLRQTWKASIWSEKDDDPYTLPDPEIPLVHSLHYGQQCSPEWDHQLRTCRNG